MECIQYAFNLHVRLRWFNCCGNCICQCRPFFVLRALGLCGSSPKYVVFGLLVVIQSFLHLPSHHFHMREGPFFINFTSRRLNLATFARPGVSLFCLFLERIDSHCVCLKRTSLGSVLCENIQVALRSYIGISQTPKPTNDKNRPTHKTNPQANHQSQNPFKFRKLLLPHTKPRNVNCHWYVLFTC